MREQVNDDIKNYVKNLLHYHRLALACENLELEEKELEAADGTNRSAMRYLNGEYRKAGRKAAELQDAHIRGDLLSLERHLCEADSPSAEAMPGGDLPERFRNAQKRLREIECSQWILNHTAGMIESEHKRLSYDLAECLAEKSALETKLRQDKRAFIKEAEKPQ